MTLRKNVLIATWFFAILFLCMGGYLCLFVYQNQDIIMNNSYNPRQEILASQNFRGRIYSADGEILADTKVDETGQETRMYPYGEQFAHIVGYSQRGRTGIEELANSYLIQSNIPVSDKVMNEVSGMKNPGDNVYTTLDAGLQEAAYKALGTYRGAIIVTEPSTGRILAMVSKPDFNPNEIPDIWDNIIANEDSSVLVNRATQGLYPPGSTFKILTALEYYRQNNGLYEDYSYDCRGYYKCEDEKISCYHGMSHKKVDFTTSFAKSCNASFANIGASLERNAFLNTLEGLLFNQNLPLKLSYSKSKVAMNDEMSQWEVLQTDIGQGKTMMTPIHLNMITCAIANHGVLMEPYVLERVESRSGTVVRRFREKEYGRLLSTEEADFLTEIMVQVVETGTGDALAGQTYTAAGKTGSAEYNNRKGDSHAWFTGFAPADNPQICVTVILEDGGSGGEYAAPAAKRIFNAYFKDKVD